MFTRSSQQGEEPTECSDSRGGSEGFNVTQASPSMGGLVSDAQREGGGVSLRSLAAAEFSQGPLKGGCGWLEAWKPVIHFCCGGVPGRHQ